jgi:hypothetical protein
MRTSLKPMPMRSWYQIDTVLMIPSMACTRCALNGVLGGLTAGPVRIQIVTGKSRRGLNVTVQMSSPPDHGV